MRVALERRAGFWFAFQCGSYGLCGLVLTVVWAVAGHRYFWPAWFWFGAVLTVGIQVGVDQASRARGGTARRLVLHAWMTAITAAALLVIWGLSGTSTFWPVYPLLGIAFALAVHALIEYREWLPGGRERELTRRVDELTRTRRGALEVQAAELRRIERDLHDGAQARLVALTLHLGSAEEQLEDQPEIAARIPEVTDLLRRAREDAREAIAELRDLARGISPPVLADRGLGAAVEALAQRSATPVTTDVALERRPGPAIETAAYFVIAEALTNAAKHAPAATVRVKLHERDEHLLIEIGDDGPGDADPAGNGLSGMQQRIAALDGSLTITSRPQVGTLIHAELPCVW